MWAAAAAPEQQGPDLCVLAAALGRQFQKIPGLRRGMDALLAASMSAGIEAAAADQESSGQEPGSCSSSSSRAGGTISASGAAASCRRDAAGGWCGGQDSGGLLHQQLQQLALHKVSTSVSWISSCSKVCVASCTAMHTRMHCHALACSLLHCQRLLLKS
jgi:hypothetical protein